MKRRGREGEGKIREEGERREKRGRGTIEEEREKVREKKRERGRGRERETSMNYITHQVHYEDHVTHKPSAQSGGLLVYILKTDAILLFSPAPPSLSLPPLAVAP